jgi:ankyrin repeat protein
MRHMDERLHRAVIFGDIEAARKLLRAGADVNAEDGNGATPLVFAAAKGDLEITRLLLEHGANTRVMRQGIPASSLAQRHPEVLALLLEAEGAAYFDAARSGDMPALEAALDGGAGVDRRNDEDRTALGLATENGHDAAVALLLERGAEVAARDRYGRTPLMLAAAKGHTAVVRRLLDRGADAHARNRWNQTPLLLAARGQAREVADLLTAAGATLGLVEHIYLCDGDRAREMLASSADVNAAAPDGTTPLMAAAAVGDVDLMRLLLEHGADLNAATGLGATALATAVMAANRPAVEFLLAGGADVNPADSTRIGPLHSAVIGRNLGLVDLLQEHGADVNAVDHMVRTPLHWIASASPEFNEGVAPVLARQGIEAGPETDAAILDALMRAGAHVDVRESRFARLTPLMEAVEMGTPDTVRRLLKAGADPNARAEIGGTPLAMAAERKAVNIASALLDGGADPNPKDDVPPLLIAVGNEDTAMSGLLRRHGARLGIGDVIAGRALGVIRKHPDIMKEIYRHVEKRSRADDPDTPDRDDG